MACAARVLRWRQAVRRDSAYPFSFTRNQAPEPCSGWTSRGWIIYTRPATRQFSLTVMLVDSTDAAFLWVGSIECLIEATNKKALARYIGTVIGWDFGRRVQNRRI